MLNVCCPAGEWVQEVGRIYIDNEAIVVKQALTDMQNILGFAANGDVEAMQCVFADQGSMVRLYRHGAVLPAMPATSLTLNVVPCPSGGWLFAHAVHPGADVPCFKDVCGCR